MLSWDLGPYLGDGVSGAVWLVKWGVVLLGIGAGEGIRTLDHLLGRQVLYQPELLPLDSTHSNLKTMCRQKRVSLWRANAGC